MAIVVIEYNDETVKVVVEEFSGETSEDFMSRAFNAFNDVFGLIYLEDYIDFGGGVFAAMLKSHKNEEWIRLVKISVNHDPK